MKKDKEKKSDKLVSYSDWLTHWREKALQKNQNLRSVSGYEGKLSYLSEKTSKILVNSIVKHLSLKPTDILLDVGCGAGMLTVPLQKFVGRIIGIDPVIEMLEYLPRTIKTYVAKADKLPFLSEKFDKILCHSIFQYFPNEEYALRVIKELERVCKPGGLIYIVDIPDNEQEVEYNKYKKKEKHTLKRLFYAKNFFAQIFPESNIFDNKLKGYGNAKFRFNVLVKK